MVPIMKCGLTTDVPSGAKLAMEIEVEGTFWTAQSQPAVGSTTQPQAVVRTYKSPELLDLRIIQEKPENWILN